MNDYEFRALLNLLFDPAPSSKDAIILYKYADELAKLYGFSGAMGAFDLFDPLKDTNA